MDSFKNLFRLRSREGREEAVGSSTTTPTDSSSPLGLALWHDSSSTEAASVDVVFIHGLMGHRENTWRGTAPDGTKLKPWPKTFLPASLARSRLRIFSFGYDANVLDKGGRGISTKLIRDHAIELVSSLGHRRRTTRTLGRPIIFVCHSLGGLVCKDAFIFSCTDNDRDFRDIANSTSSIIFMGTPHTGSAIADFARPFAQLAGTVRQTNAGILEVLRTDSEVLGRIHDDFLRLRSRTGNENERPIELVCFWEELPTPRAGHIVPKASAVLQESRQRGIHANHRGMTKFSHTSDPGYRSFLEEFSKLVQNTSRRPASARPQIKSPSPSAPSHASGPWFVVPYPKNELFMGRSSVLGRISEWVGSPIENQREGFHRRVAIHGLGGVGKTQVALQWAYEMRQQYPSLSVFWVHGSTIERFKDCYAHIAKTCEIPGCEADDPDLLSKVRDWMASRDQKTPWIMVIDNADDIRVFCGRDAMERYIPETPNGSILFTSRAREVAVDLAHSPYLFSMKEPRPEESLAIMRRRLSPGNGEDQELQELSEYLGHLPLALAQATAYLNKKSLSVSQYLKRLRASDSEDLMMMLEYEFKESRRGDTFDDRVPNAVARTWLVSLQAMSQENSFAIELLHLAGCIDRQEIPISFFLEFVESYSYYTYGLFQKRCADKSKGPEESLPNLSPPTNLQWTPGKRELEEALSLLMGYSFFARGRDENTFTLHRLVHLVIRRQLDQDGRMARTSSQSMAIISELLNDLIPCDRKENWPRVLRVLPHIKSVLENEISTEYLHVVLVKSSLLTNHATILQRIGGFKDTSIAMLEEAIKLQESAGKSPLHQQGNLASILLQLGKPAAALGVLEQALRSDNSVQTRNRLQGLKLRGIMAKSYQDLGRLDEAAGTLADVIDQLASEQGDMGMTTLSTLITRMDLFGEQGRLSEAMALSRYLLYQLQFSRDGDGQNINLSLDCTFFLSSLLFAQGHRHQEEARAVIRLSAQMLKLYLPKGHPRIAKQETLMEEVEFTSSTRRSKVYMEAAEKRKNGQLQSSPSTSKVVNRIIGEYQSGWEGEKPARDDWRQSWSWTHFPVYKEAWRLAQLEMAAKG